MLKRKYILIGAPDDRGVAAVGGRVGAKEGPAAIRQALKRLGFCGFEDGGDIPIRETQEETYAVLADRLAQYHRTELFPVFLGGGHDLSFGSLSGFLRVYPNGGIVNIDPHLDCRPIPESGKIPSGSPYRLLLERQCLKGKQLMAYGYQPHCNNQANYDYLKEQEVLMVSWPCHPQSIRKFAQSVPALAVSFDIDCIQADFAPGVSAPAKVGYTDEEALSLIRTIKELPNLKQLEIMELNPKVDLDEKTAKLAACLLSELLAD